MYKAIREIGEYKIGDEVPADKAIAWNKMYAVPHVEQVSDKPPKKEEVPKKSVVEKVEAVDSSDSILDDYLARSGNVVKKNVSTDNLSKDQLEKLLNLEKKNKNRFDVISAIRKRL